MSTKSRLDPDRFEIAEVTLRRPTFGEREYLREFDATVEIDDRQAGSMRGWVALYLDQDELLDRAELHLVRCVDAC